VPHVSRFRSNRMGSSSRRKTAWSGGPNEPGNSITAAGAFLWLNGAQVVPDGLTQIRVRGEYSFVLSVVTSIGDGYASMGVGICIVSENAFGVGVTAVPSPLTDISWDGWLYHRLHSNIFGRSTTELGVSPMEAQRVEIDSRAMRKVKGSDFTIGVVELGAETGAATVVFSAQTRLLDKLP